ncbi:transposase, partial [Desulfoscipio geothermicus]
MGEERRVYSSEFKKEAVELTKTSGKKISHIAKDLGISVSNLRRWCRNYNEYGNNSFPGHGKRIPGTSEEEEIRRLKREL